MSETMSSVAHVKTERPERYGKQLAHHFSRKIEADWDEEAKKGFAAFPNEDRTETIRCDMVAAEGELLLTLTGSESEIGRIEGVVARHLVRFGKRGELEVEFLRDNGEKFSFVYEEESHPRHK